MTTCKKPHQKINFLADAILFWKLNFACNYSRHPNFKRKYLKIMFNDLWIDNHLLIFSITLSEWSVDLSEQKWCSDFDYFDFSRFYGLFLRAKLLKNMKNGHFREFFGHKNIKSKIIEIPTSLLMASTSGAYKQNFRRIPCLVFNS